MGTAGPTRRELACWWISPWRTVEMPAEPPIGQDVRHGAALGAAQGAAPGRTGPPLTIRVVGRIGELTLEVGRR